MMSSAYVLNEFTVFGFTVAVLTGRRPYVIGVESVIPRLGPALEKLAKKFIESGAIM